MAMLFGGLLALIHAFFSIHLRADQIVSGFAVNLLALGATGFLFTQIYPDGIPLGISRVPNVELGFIDRIPIAGDFLYGVFGSLTQLSGFGTDSYPSFIVPISIVGAIVGRIAYKRARASSADARFPASARRARPTS